MNASVHPFTVSNNNNVLFKVDTGADVFILCKPTYVNTFQDAKLIGFVKSAIVITAYRGTDIEVLGSATAKMPTSGSFLLLRTNRLSITLPGADNQVGKEDPQGERRWNPKNLHWGVVFVSDRDLIECSTFGSTISH